MILGVLKVYKLTGSVFKSLQKFSEGALQRAETTIGGFRSSLSIFCKVDVGLYFDEDETPHYFVNEVERTPTTSLWRREIPDRELRTIPHTFAHVLHTYLQDLYQPYILL